jgi:hypothetical protein
MGTAKRMALQTTYQFLEPRAESNYRQLFVRGRSLRAEILYRATIGAEPRTPEEVAADFGVPLAAVHEAVHYCSYNEELLRQEREAVLADIRARGFDKPPMYPSMVACMRLYPNDNITDRRVVAQLQRIGDVVCGQ